MLREKAKGKQRRDDNILVIWVAHLVVHRYYENLSNEDDARKMSRSDYHRRHRRRKGRIRVSFN